MKPIATVMRYLKGYLGMSNASADSDLDSSRARALAAEHHMASQLSSAAWYVAAMHEKLVDTALWSADYPPALHGYLQAKAFYDGLQDGAIAAGRAAAARTNARHARECSSDH
jgi:hypothetical protein